MDKCVKDIYRDMLCNDGIVEHIERDGNCYWITISRPSYWLYDEPGARNERLYVLCFPTAREK